MRSRTATRRWLSRSRGRWGSARAVATQGTEAQRERHLAALPVEYAGLRRGRHPRCGLVLRARTGNARQASGNGWRIKGAKALVPLARRCDRLLVTAETQEGVQGFIVEARSPRLRIEPAKGTLGMRALQMADIVLDGVEVTDDDLMAGPMRRIIDASRIVLTAVLSAASRGRCTITPYPT